MVQVEYHHEFAYAYDPNGRQYPRLTFRLVNPVDPDRAIDVDAYLDSGAERSLFDGQLLPVLGIELLAGTRFLSSRSPAPRSRQDLMRFGLFIR